MRGRNSIFFFTVVDCRTKECWCGDGRWWTANEMAKAYRTYTSLRLNACALTLWSHNAHACYKYKYTVEQFFRLAAANTLKRAIVLETFFVSSSPQSLQCNSWAHWISLLSIGHAVSTFSLATAAKLLRLDRWPSLRLHTSCAALVSMSTLTPSAFAFMCVCFIFHSENISKATETDVSWRSRLITRGMNMSPYT